MIRLTAVPALFAATFLTACAASRPDPLLVPQFAAERAAPAPVAAAPMRVDEQRMSEIARVLASDEFAGRAPGTEGERKTVAYLIAQMKAAGLEPGGTDGGWTQQVPIVGTRLIDPKLSVTQAGKTRDLPFGGDIYVSTVRPVERADIDNAPMVFVGYGVTAPERGWDDFKGADLTGKVAVFLVNDPDFAAQAGEEPFGKFGGKAMTFYGRWVYKFEEAARRGAIGALVVHETEAAGYGWNVAGGGTGANKALADAAGPTPPMLQGWIQGPAFARIARGAGLDPAKLMEDAKSSAFRPVDLKARFTARAGVALERFQSDNVIGKLTGTTRPQETVSYGTHWDAFGVGKPDAEGRTIRPGAADDALGIGALIEVARLFAAGPRPDRTLIFASFTAEESGLLGSEYYAANPLYPMSKMAANLTFDTLQWAGPTRDTVVIGQGQSAMEDLLAEEAAKQGRTVTPESHPERGLFYRADHFSFAKRGVPVLLSMALAGEYDLVDGGKAAGAKWLGDFTGNCYHQPCDAWSADWNLGGAAQEANLYYAIGRRLAFSNDWPAWRDSSEFKRVRAETASERR